MQVTRLALAGLCLAAAPTLQAQTAATPAAPAPNAAAGAAMPASSTPRFAIQGFKVTGENPLSDSDTQAVLAPFVRPDATLETLQQAAAALEASLRARGFGLHRVALPPQEITSTVSLSIVRFTIGKVTVEGNQYYSEDNIRRSIPELKEGGTPNFKQLAVQAAIANDNPSKQIQVALKESKEADKIDAGVKVTETKPWNFALSASNAGSDASGNDRVTVSGSHSNLFDRDHQFTGAYTTSVQNPSGVRQFGASYRLPVYALNGVVGVQYTRSDVVGDFGAFQSTGAGHTLGVNYTYSLPPEGGYRGFLTAGLDDKVYDALVINGAVVAGQLDRRSRPLHVGYNARSEGDQTYWNYSAELAFNTGGGSGNSLAAYQTEDPRITSTNWNALRVGGGYLAGFADGWVWNIRGQGQWTNDALIAGEQFGLGGVGSVRGTGERPISGDRGLQVTFEVTTPALWQGLRLLGFVDAGWLSNINPNATNKPGNDQLASFGLGLRYTQGKASISADWGHVFRGSNVPLTVNQLAPKSGDNKLHVNLTYQF